MLALCPLCPLSYRATRSTCDNFPLLNKIRPQICSEPCRNRRDSPFCCSQPEHRPTLSHQLSQGRKNLMARRGLEPRTSRIPCEQSDHCTTEPNGRPVTEGFKHKGSIIHGVSQKGCFDPLYTVINFAVYMEMSYQDFALKSQ